MVAIIIPILIRFNFRIFKYKGKARTIYIIPILLLALEYSRNLNELSTFKFTTGYYILKRYLFYRLRNLNIFGFISITDLNENQEY